MIVNRYEKTANLYTDVSKIYKNVGKDTSLVAKKTEDKEGKIEIADLTYKNSVKRKELFLGLEAIKNYDAETSKALDETSEKDYTVWRYKSCNHFADVESCIGLFPEKVEISPSVSIESDKAEDFLDKFNRHRDKIWRELDVLRYSLLDAKKDSQAGAVAQASTIREFNSIKTFKGIKNLLSGLTFEIPFSYGQFGLFDAYKEVVVPMCALMGIYTPVRSKENSGGMNLYNTPYPSDTYLTSKQFVGLVGNVSNLVLPFLDNKEGTNDTSVQDGKTKPETNVDWIHKEIQRIEQCAIAGLLDVLQDTGWQKTKWKYTTFRYGNFKIGPCEIKNVESEFDFKHLDSRGYPYKGKLKIMAECLMTATNDTIIEFFLS